VVQLVADRPSTQSGVVELLRLDPVDDRDVSPSTLFIIAIESMTPPSSAVGSATLRHSPPETKRITSTERDLEASPASRLLDQIQQLALIVRTP
jgi:hypothetical protein